MEIENEVGCVLSVLVNNLKTLLQNQIYISKKIFNFCL